MKVQRQLNHKEMEYNYNLKCINKKLVVPIFFQRQLNHKEMEYNYNLKCIIKKLVVPIFGNQALEDYEVYHNDNITLKVGYAFRDGDIHDKDFIEYILKECLYNLKNELDDRKFSKNRLKVEYCFDDFSGEHVIQMFIYNPSVSKKDKIKKLKGLVNINLFNLIDLECSTYDIIKKIDLIKFMRKEGHLFKKLYGKDYKKDILIECNNTSVRLKPFSELAEAFNPYCSAEEKIIDEVTELKDLEQTTRRHIMNHLTDDDEIVFNEGDELLIKCLSRNVDIMSSKWCVEWSDNYFFNYNDNVGASQYILFNFKTGKHVGFNYNGEEVLTAFTWSNNRTTVDINKKWGI